MMKEKNIKLKLNSIYLLMYGALACYYPFLTIYLKDSGLSYTEVGAALAVNSLAAVICQPIWGFITDSYLNKRKTLMILMLMSSLTVFMFTLPSNYYFIIFTIIIFVAFISPISSIMDAYCYQIIGRYEKIQYGQVRLMGSLGYAVIALILGKIISMTNINSSFYSYFIITIVVILIIQSISFKGTSGDSKLNFKDMGELIRNKRYNLFICSVLIANIAIGANSNYIALLIEKTGGNVTSLGILWFIVAISELPLFYFGGKLLKRYGDLNLYLVGITLYALRFFLNSLSPTYEYVMAVQLMQGITYTLYVTASLHYISKSVPAKLMTSAMTIYAAIGGGLGGFLGDMGSGMFLESHSIFTLNKVFALMCLIGLLIALALKADNIFKKDSGSRR